MLFSIQTLRKGGAHEQGNNFPLLIRVLTPSHQVFFPQVTAPEVLGLDKQGVYPVGQTTDERQDLTVNEEHEDDS